MNTGSLLSTEAIALDGQMQWQGRYESIEERAARLDLAEDERSVSPQEEADEAPSNEGDLDEGRGAEGPKLQPGGAKPGDKDTDGSPAEERSPGETVSLVLERMAALKRQDKGIPPPKLESVIPGHFVAGNGVACASYFKDGREVEAIDVEYEQAVGRQFEIDVDDYTAKPMQGFRGGFYTLILVLKVKVDGKISCLFQHTKSSSKYRIEYNPNEISLPLPEYSIGSWFAADLQAVDGRFEIKDISAIDPYARIGAASTQSQEDQTQSSTGQEGESPEEEESAPALVPFQSEPLQPIPPYRDARKKPGPQLAQPGESSGESGGAPSTTDSADGDTPGGDSPGNDTAVDSAKTQESSSSAASSASSLHLPTGYSTSAEEPIREGDRLALYHQNGEIAGGPWKVRFEPAQAALCLAGYPLRLLLGKKDRLRLAPILDLIHQEEIAKSLHPKGVADDPEGEQDLEGRAKEDRANVPDDLQLSLLHHSATPTGGGTDD